jgi:uncharacterized protein
VIPEIDIWRVASLTLKRYGDEADIESAIWVGAVGRIGPSFDCNKAGYPLALMLCADADLSRIDIPFGQAYWAFFQQVGPAGQPQLKQEDLAFFDQRTVRST